MPRLKTERFGCNRVIALKNIKPAVAELVEATWRRQADVPSTFLKDRRFWIETTTQFQQKH
jgi:hypothetical protein